MANNPTDIFAIAEEEEKINVECISHLSLIHLTFHF